jgi:hypothetical protein
MELISNISETVSISGIGVLCEERQSRTTSSQPNFALKIPRLGCKMQGEALSPNPLMMDTEIISGAYNSFFTWLVT